MQSKKHAKYAGEHQVLVGYAHPQSVVVCSVASLHYIDKATPKQPQVSHPKLTSKGVYGVWVVNAIVMTDHEASVQQLAQAFTSCTAAF